MHTNPSILTPSPFDYQALLSLEEKHKDLKQEMTLKLLQDEFLSPKIDFQEFFKPQPFFGEIDLDLSSFNSDSLQLTLNKNSDTILIARPLKEFFSHICHFKIPSLELIVRVIKTLVLSVFRWHLCDSVLLEQSHGLLKEKVISQFSGDVSQITILDFELAYPYLLENAYRLSLSQCKLEEHDFDDNELCPDTLRDYFEKCYQIQITSKSFKNTIHDLFQSQELILEDEI